MSPKQLALLIEIVRRGGTVICSAATYAQLTARPSAKAAWAGVRVRISPHMPHMRIAAFTHDSRSAPVELTDR